MKAKILGLLAVGLLAGPMASQAAPVVISFDDFPTPGGVGSQNALLGTFYASQGVTFSTSCYAYSGDSLYPAYSGTNIAICAPFPAVITFSTEVSNVGAFFNNYGSDLTFSAFGNTGFLGSTVIPTTTQPTPGGPQLYELAFAGITRVEISSTNSSASGFQSFDDLTFTPSSMGVPEPGTLALLGLGLAGLGLSRRRRTN